MTGCCPTAALSFIMGAQVPPLQVSPLLLLPSTAEPTCLSVTVGRSSSSAVVKLLSLLASLCMSVNPPLLLFEPSSSVSVPISSVLLMIVHLLQLLLHDLYPDLLLQKL